MTRQSAPSLGPGAVFGGALRLGGSSFARWVAFAFGCLGIVAFYRVLLAQPNSGANRAAVSATVFACSSLPSIAYAATKSS